MIEDKSMKLGRLLRARANEDGTVELKGVSFTQISMYLRCPRQYQHRYIEGKKTPPAVALTEGTAHHTSMETDNRRKRDQGKQVPAKELTEIFVAKFDAEVERGAEDAEKLKTKFDWEDETRDGIIKRAVLLHEDYALNHSPNIKPEKIESPFAKTITVDGVEVLLFGQLDLTNRAPGGLELLDYKTSAKSKSQRDVDSDLQLTLNSWAQGLNDVGWIALVKDKPHIQQIRSKRTPGQQMWALKVVANAVKSIRAGQFPLTNPGAFPAPWWCSKSYCGYWDMCRGQYEG